MACNVVEDAGSWFLRIPGKTIPDSTADGNLKGQHVESLKFQIMIFVYLSTVL